MSFINRKGLYKSKSINAKKKNIIIFRSIIDYENRQKLRFSLFLIIYNINRF